MCIAYSFPPINRSGTHRTLAFVRHLHTLGWDATVIAADGREESLDQTLCSRIPASTVVRRTPWFDPIRGIKSLVERVRRVSSSHDRVDGQEHIEYEAPAKTAREFGASSRKVASPASPLSKGGSRGVLQRLLNLPQPLLGKEGGRKRHDLFGIRTNATRIQAQRTPDGNARALAYHHVYQSRTQSVDRNLRDWFSRLLLTPDAKTGWLPFALAAALRAVRRRRPNVLFSTSPCMTAHVVALAVSYVTRIPWVVDLRDPWVDNPYRDLGYESLRWWDTRIEAAVLRRADHVICNTPTMTQRLRQRVSAVSGKCTTILNGIDRDSLCAVNPIRMAARDEFVLTHCGQFYGKRSPLPLLRALRWLIEHAPDLAGQLRLALVGPSAFDGTPLADLVEKAGVASNVDILGTMNHQASLAIMAGSDAVALIGSTGPGSDLQIPNKLFEYLALKRPILALVTPKSPIVPILQDANAVAEVGDPTDPADIARGISKLMAKRLSISLDAWSGVPRYDRAHRTRELATIFDRIAPKRNQPAVVTAANARKGTLGLAKAGAVAKKDGRATIDSHAVGAS